MHNFSIKKFTLKVLTMIRETALAVTDANGSHSLADARMAEPNAKIRNRKLKRRGLDDSDDEERKERFGRTPYRKLSILEKFTPPRKKSEQIAPDSDEYSP
jgi:hypothetical protein